MLINCKYCNSKFAINAEEVGFDGRLVKCENCQKEWFQESKPKYLEKKLIELDRSLHATELHLIEQKNIHNDKIAKLEKSLKSKKTSNKNIEKYKNISLDRKMKYYELLGITCDQINETKKSFNYFLKVNKYDFNKITNKKVLNSFLFAIEKYRKHLVYNLKKSL